jgi:hypothetical protein
MTTALADRQDEQMKRIEEIGARFAAQNPGFEEYLKTQPPYTNINLEEVIEKVDIHSRWSIAWAYFCFALAEAERPNARLEVRPRFLDVFINQFEDMALNPPGEDEAQSNALMFGDSLETAKGVGDDPAYGEEWGASIQRLRDFEKRCRVGVKTSV